MSVTHFEPHRIAFYLQELASLLHELWNEGMSDQDLRFIIKNNAQLTKARIYLLISVTRIIKSALAIFNIKPLKEMR